MKNFETPDENYRINENLVYRTMGVPREAMEILGAFNVPIKYFRNPDGTFDRNSGRVIDVPDSVITKWAAAVSNGDYDDTIFCPPVYIFNPVLNKPKLVAGFCKTKGHLGAEVDEIRAIKVKFKDYAHHSAEHWAEIAGSNENTPLEEREDFIKTDRTPEDIVGTLISIGTKMFNEDGNPTDYYVNKNMVDMKIPDSQKPTIRNLLRDKLEINTHLNVRTVTSTEQENKKFQEDVKKLYLGKNIGFFTLGQASNPKLPTDAINKILDQRHEGKPYDIVVFKYTKLSNTEKLTSCRKRDINFFTSPDLHFQINIKRYQSPLGEGPHPKILFEPQTDVEISKWISKKTLPEVN